MKEKILETLKKNLEFQHNIQILMAVEAGSRAWGFESKNSDYDVRFIFMHPNESYLSFINPKEQVDYNEDDLDISGWDIRKTLRLISSSNPSLYEWMYSPIIYINLQDSHYSFIHQLKSISKDYYSNKAIFLHYLNMAKGNVREYLKGDKVWLKKYLYVIRPLIACNYIEQTNELPPVNFDLLLSYILPRSAWGNDFINDLKYLIEQKKKGNELSMGDPIPSLQNFINIEIERLAKLNIKSKVQISLNKLNKFYMDLILECREFI